MNSFDQVWEAIERHAGETFQQVRGGTFTYAVKGDSVIPDRTNRQLPKEHFRKALRLAPFPSTSVLQHLQGPSYLYAILMDRRIRPVWDSNGANWTSAPSTLAPGMLVNSPPNSTVDAAMAREREANSHSGLGRGMQRARICDLEAVDRQTTAYVIACSGSKVNAGLSNRNISAGPSVIDSLPSELASRLLEARASVRKHVQFDERALMPAVERYSGAFYQAARNELVRAVDRSLHVLIVSGGYGVLTASEPIGLYDAAFNPAWWPRQVVADCVAAYAARHGLTSMVAFLAASTGYARALRDIGRRPVSENLKHAFLVTAVAEGGGAMQTVPRALGQAFTAFRRGELKPDWRSSDGLGLAVWRLK